MLHSRRFYYVLFVIGALYALLVQQFFKHEGRLIIQSKSYPKETVYSFKQVFQELNLTINQDINLNGIWFKNENTKGLFLIFPDSKENLKSINISLNNYFNNGFDVLITAYRGSAKSEGTLKSETDLYYDAQNWYNFAISQFRENNIVIVGQGFGGSIAASLASNNNPKALILESPYFANGETFSKTHFFWLPYNYFTAFPLKTWESVRKTTCEIVLIQTENRKIQKNYLSNFLKSSDKIIDLKDQHNKPYSGFPENAVFFNKIINQLFQPAQSDSLILKIK
jgi:esterase/lipase